MSGSQIWIYAEGSVWDGDGEPADKWDEDDALGRFNRLSHDTA